MVLYLLKRDESLKVALVCTLLAPMVLLGGGSGPLVFVQQVAFIGFFCGIRLGLFHRGTRFQMALPIPGRDLLLVKLAGTLLAIWLPIAMAALFLAAKHRHGWQSLLQGGAVLTFGAILPLTVRLREGTLSPPVSIALPVSALAAGFGAWFVLSPIAHFAVFAAISGILVLRACLLVPDAFEVLPRRASNNRKSHSFWRFPAPVWWALTRTAMPWVGAVIFVWVYCFTVNVAKALPYTVPIFAVGLFCRTRSIWLLSLPLSRRAFLWLMLGVTLVPFLAGVAAATWIYRPSFMPVLRPRVGEFMGLDVHDFHLGETNVPLEFWRHAPAGKVPLIEAPWGETVVPRTMSVLGFSLYNPYTATNANSDRFFDWQFENATQAVHGRRISYGQYQQIPNDATLGYPRQKRMDVIAFPVLAFWLLCGAYLQELTLSRRISGTGLVQLLSAASVILLGGGFILVDALSFIVLRGTGVPTSLLQALFMRIAALPLPTWTLAAIGAVPCLAMYLLLERQSARSEIVNMPAVTTAL